MDKGSKQRALSWCGALAPHILNMLSDSGLHITTRLMLDSERATHTFNCNSQYTLPTPYLSCHQNLNGEIHRDRCIKKPRHYHATVGTCGSRTICFHVSVHMKSGLWSICGPMKWYSKPLHNSGAPESKWPMAI